ncbi:MAG: Fic family protein [Planctomycetota bacterium]
MGFEPQVPTLTYLERLDVKLATRMVPRAETLDLRAPPETWAHLLVDATMRTRPAAGLVCGHLELRGVDLRLTEVQAALTGRAGRYQPGQQEYAFIQGMARCLALLRQRAEAQVAPDGAFAVDLFRAFAGDLARFKANWLRRDMPWDGLIYVPYPDASEVPRLLGSFVEATCYRDLPLRFARLHPVRQAFRVLWRLARIAPFPDFNVLIAFLAMNTYLLVKGYPAITPMPGDRELLNKVLSGPPPARIAAFEARLADCA